MSQLVGIIMITSSTLPLATALHPDYTEWAKHWRMIRDADMGEIAVKQQGQKYLKKLQGHDAEQYAAYLDRAVFYNMTAKTLNSLYGTVFRKNPRVTNLPPSMKPMVSKFTKSGISLNLTAKTTVKEVLAVGRFGLLVDAAPSGAGLPYVAAYNAEDILDWEVGEVDGHDVLIRVVLREANYEKKEHTSRYTIFVRYRMLILDETGTYRQFVYDSEDSFSIPDFSTEPAQVITPLVRGNPIDYIPFVIVGPFTNTPNIQKPPILDIVTLNMSHYRTYAQLEQGQFYTANPVYYVSGSSADDGDPEYYVGPDIVWELGKDGKAGLIEYQGTGLKSLESALHTKEAQIAAIGGRMMPGTSSSTGESDNSLKLKEQNEQTLLLNISDTVDEALTYVLKWLADWNSVPRELIDKIQFELNRDFLLKDIGAREFRAIHQMYADGVIPIQVVFEYLSKNDVIPAWMDSDEFVRLLEDSKQFPNMVDVLARMRDFPDAKTMFEHTTALKTQTEVTSTPQEKAV